MVLAGCSAPVGSSSDAGTDSAPFADSAPSADGASAEQDSGSSDSSAAPDACGPTCGGECLHGRCLVALATRQFNPSGIAVNASGVFWANYAKGIAGIGTVMGTTLAGGTLTTLASAQNAPSTIAVDAANVYWVNDGVLGNPSSPAVMSAPASGPGGGSGTQLASSNTGAFGIAIDSANVYWANNTSLLDVPLGGGKVSTLAALTSDDAFSGMALGGTNLFWTSDADNVVMRIPVGGGAPATFAPGQYPSGVAANATNVAWVNPLGQGTVLGCTVAGCTTPTILSAGADERFPTAIAIDDTSAYWISSCSFLSVRCGEQNTTGYFPTDSVVMKVPLVGGTPETLVSIGGSVSGSIAVDGTSVYWTDGADFGTVRKLTPK